jgi:hypothetical protein
MQARYRQTTFHSVTISASLIIHRCCGIFTWRRMIPRLSSRKSVPSNQTDIGSTSTPIRRVVLVTCMMTVIARDDMIGPFRQWLIWSCWSDQLLLWVNTRHTGVLLFAFIERSLRTAVLAPRRFETCASPLVGSLQYAISFPVEAHSRE